MVAEWDAELERLLAEARRDRAASVDVPLPSSLSATSLSRLRDDPDSLRPRAGPADAAAALAGRAVRHPLPRLGRVALRPAGPASTPTSCPAVPTPASTPTRTCAALVAAFEAGPFADRRPQQVEAPFALVLAGQVVRGRIDAVYREPDGGYLVVDWKTNRRAHRRPVAAGALPSGLGRAPGSPGGVGPGGLLLRADRSARRAVASRPGRAGGAGPRPTDAAAWLPRPGRQPGRSRSCRRRSARAPGRWSPRR